MDTSVYKYRRITVKGDIRGSRDASFRVEASYMDEAAMTNELSLTHKPSLFGPCLARKTRRPAYFLLGARICWSPRQGLLKNHKLQLSDGIKFVARDGSDGRFTQYASSVGEIRVSETPHFSLRQRGFSTFFVQTCTCTDYSHSVEKMAMASEYSGHPARQNMKNAIFDTKRARKTSPDVGIRCSVTLSSPLSTRRGG
ncbi:hypothetical protein BaRGS_00039382 [Batillaria attramentaria]|uniref:Uncharacterized protein n=1 Tax=Batillaria attramentaria TaxID=370345 RepID=A0ABD0J387_9CAEN